MVDIERANAYSEVLEILKYLTPEDYNKIPKEKIEVFETYANKEYTFNYDPDKTLQEQNVSKTARTIIGILFRDYWATEEQKEKIIKWQQQERVRIENEKQEKYKSEDIFKNMTAMTDVLLASASVYQTNKSQDIHENSKKALIYNNIISTVVTVIGGYFIDNVVKKRTAHFIEKFKKANEGNPKLPKYIEGINIMRPALIFAGIYYVILPIFSTYFSDKIDDFIQNRKLTSLINLHNKQSSQT